ncbi:hypothetical protein EX30DRAFT_397653 [Ascodesmis nigricans]|uniref:Uncharacterized protein n=1 Tax=Ascodesmis nigricans TaxID=341454 RepID=A0A4V3SI45_9PEZI|nr:hypothetical protein EX30DRAFT_397653 [Ascodesmis nigricans]
MAFSTTTMLPTPKSLPRRPSWSSPQSSFYNPEFIYPITALAAFADANKSSSNLVLSSESNSNSCSSAGSSSYSSFSPSSLSASGEEKDDKDDKDDENEYHTYNTYYSHIPYYPHHLDYYTGHLISIVAPPKPRTRSIQHPMERWSPPIESPPIFDTGIGEFLPQSPSPSPKLLPQQQPQPDPHTTNTSPKKRSRLWRRREGKQDAVMPPQVNASGRKGTTVKRPGVEVIVEEVKRAEDADEEYGREWEVTSGTLMERVVEVEMGGRTLACYDGGGMDEEVVGEMRRDEGEGIQVIGW